MINDLRKQMDREDIHATEIGVDATGYGTPIRNLRCSVFTYKMKIFSPSIVYIIPTDRLMKTLTRHSQAIIQAFVSRFGNAVKSFDRFIPHHYSWGQMNAVFLKESYHPPTRSYFNEGHPIETRYRHFPTLD
ncbi:hypothetical protein CDAR_20681 [Caerostris darwini]|uniref:Uncharacterized protein n=1 Tax=Caerostris darwini TaxID=1538125 RepID=A0AAV4QGE8_9ARAC|nr:hypothetical protein CDAR_20681 [Caerostris darwini]